MKDIQITIIIRIKDAMSRQPPDDSQADYIGMPEYCHFDYYRNEALKYASKCENQKSKVSQKAWR